MPSPRPRAQNPLVGLQGSLTSAGMNHQSNTSYDMVGSWGCVAKIILVHKGISWVWGGGVMPSPQPRTRPPLVGRIIASTMAELRATHSSPEPKSCQDSSAIDWASHSGFIGSSPYESCLNHMKFDVVKGRPGSGVYRSGIVDCSLFSDDKISFFSWC